MHEVWVGVILMTPDCGKTRSEDTPLLRLHFGKPYADITVDAHAINSQGDLSRELGWYVGQARLFMWGLRLVSSGAFCFDLLLGQLQYLHFDFRCHE